MDIFLLNELGIGIFFIAEHDRENDTVTVTFYEKKPAPKRGAFANDHLHSGQSFRMGELDEDITFEIDLSNLSISAKMETDPINGGVVFKIKMQNGTHRIEQYSVDDETELEIEFTPEDDDPDLQ